MGGTTYSSAAWTKTATAAATRSVQENFRSSDMHKDLDPSAMTIRESRDSTVNPITTPVLVCLDVSGSMGTLAQQIATKGLGQIFEELLKRGCVPGPQFAFAGIGDVACDRAPLQISQFESDTDSLTAQLEKLYLEGGGGGNDSESYNLAWVLAATRISHDAFEKRGKKGYLFTVGDECTPPDLSAYDLKSVFGASESEMSNKDLLEQLDTQWHVFHVIVEQGDYMRHPRRRAAVVDHWKDLLGQRILMLDKIEQLSEVVVSAIAVTEGSAVEEVVASWGGKTAVTVARALSAYAPVVKSMAHGSGLTRF